MVEPKYFIQLHLNGDLARIELKSLLDEQTTHSSVTIDWVSIDELIPLDAMSSLKEQAVTALRQCVVSANAAPGKILDLQIHVNEEPFFFGVNSKNAAESVVISNLDSFDEQLQLCIDTVKLHKKNALSNYTFMPFHSWLAMQFGLEKEHFYMLEQEAEKSIFFNKENATWHKGAFEALKLSPEQLPKIKKTGETVSKNEIGLVTSVAEIEINFQ
jgi:hypothetical protein